MNVVVAETVTRFVTETPFVALTISFALMRSSLVFQGGNLPRLKPGDPSRPYRRQNRRPESSAEDHPHLCARGIHRLGPVLVHVLDE